MAEFERWFVPSTQSYPRHTRLVMMLLVGMVLTMARLSPGIDRGWRSEHDLAPARGIMTGVALSSVIWLLIALLLSRL